MSSVMVTIIYAFCGGIFGASIGALWAFILCTIIAVMGALVVLAGGSDFILMQVALGPIFGPASGGFLSGVIAATYSHGVKKNHPTNSAKDIVTPLMGTSWDVLFVGGLTAVVSFYFAMLLSKIPYIQLGDTGAISIVILSLLARILFLKESAFGSRESIQKHGIFGTNNYEISWCGYMTPKPLLMMIGISMGGVSAAIASGTLSVLRPLVETGQINASLAWTVPLFFTWGISGIMLTMMALGQGVIGRVPVTHAISLVGALMFLHTEPYVGADTAILFGILGGIMGMAVQEFGARVFWNHGGNHIDPPAFSIAVNTLFINILFSFII